MKKYFTKAYLPAMLGTMIEYYDIALYGYMAPVLVQVFLPQLSPLSAYFYYFLFEFFAALLQMLGAYLFGRFGDKSGRRNAMYYAILGTSIITFCISILPTYQDIGVYAAALFALCRALQSFFLGGEYNGGVIYCLEHEIDAKRHGIVSGLYCALTVIGILVAALVATVINYLGSEYFRFAYALSFLFAISTYFLRREMQETPAYLDAKQKPLLEDKSYKHFRAFISIAVASLFFGVLYGLPTRIFNAILPIAIGISQGSIMTINTAVLGLYVILLLTFGALADRYKHSSVMRLSCLATAILAYPLMMLVEMKFLLYIIIVKVVFIILTAAFVAPFHSWAQHMFSVHHRYRNISMAYSAGKIASTFILSLSVRLFEKYHDLYIVSFILILIAIIAWRLLDEKFISERI